ncbi:MAG: hypothetical protein IKQ93_06730 [Candidatus Methanomethylophilaceae archaeon]|nr:hypothetical protein [Candidatus Methanomethylophilaceae archaeon]
MPGQKYEILPLSDLLERYGEEAVESILKDYKAVFDSATESYLHDKAIEMEKRALARTYIAKDDRQQVIGYVTLGVKCLQLRNKDEMDEKIVHRMNIDTKSDTAQCYLLGQLSRSKDAPKGFGEVLLKSAFEELKVAKRKVGCRTVRLDCHDELIPYYERYGFKFICKNADGTLNQMVTFI